MLIIEFQPKNRIIQEAELDKILKSLPKDAFIRSPLGNEIQNTEEVQHG